MAMILFLIVIRMSEIVNERDKPFIIALVFIIGFFALLFMGAVGILWNNASIADYVKEMIVGVVGILGTIVGFYFKTKS